MKPCHCDLERKRNGPEALRFQEWWLQPTLNSGLEEGRYKAGLAWTLKKEKWGGSGSGMGETSWGAELFFLYFFPLSCSPF